LTLSIDTRAEIRRLHQSGVSFNLLMAYYGLSERALMQIIGMPIPPSMDRECGDE
jgi:hypothetical protein